jgi:hypothetical protein
MSYRRPGMAEEVRAYGGRAGNPTPITIQVNYFVVYLLMAPSRSVPYRPVEYQAWGDRETSKISSSFFA